MTAQSQRFCMGKMGFHIFQASYAIFQKTESAIIDFSRKRSVEKNLNVHGRQKCFRCKGKLFDFETGKKGKNIFPSRCYFQFTLAHV